MNGIPPDMITRHHDNGKTRSEAIFSICEAYRYSLTRCWAEEAPAIAYIMLNPSKACERANDPTVERCERRARQLGFGAFRVVNLFAWREKDPRALRRTEHPIGPLNDNFILEAAGWADLIVAAWGVHGTHRGRGRVVAEQLYQSGHTVHHLGLTREQHPRHPLYVSYSVVPMLWRDPR